MIRRPRDASRAESSHLCVPAPPGLAYLPYQVAGIEYTANRIRVLIADEMGLGKTIQAIGTANLLGARRILVIPPASGKISWCREFEKWTTNGLTADYVEGSKSGLPTSDVVVINYELLGGYDFELRTAPWDMVIVDEAHYLKSGKADRTGQVFGRPKRGNKRALAPLPARRLVLMTGTPILNKPKDLWPLIQHLDPEGLGSNWYFFAKRYCELFEIEHFNSAKGRKERIGWDWSGASHLDELQILMRQRFMIRRLKSDVLKELPPKVRQIVVLEPKKGLTNLLKREIMAYDDYVTKHGNEDVEPPPFTEASRIRKEVAVAKVPYVIDYLKEILIEKKKVVVWAHHHEVIDAIREAFGAAATGFDGRTDSGIRQGFVDLFQNDESIQLFVGGIRAAGSLITLTAADTTLFAERDWVPGNNTQAEDRLHRIGQKGNVQCISVVLNGSNDQRIIQANIKKQEIAERALDVQPKEN